MRIIFSIIICVLIMGCATEAKDISTSYVSPLIYDNYDCDQVSSEAQRLTRKVSESASKVDERASDDSGTMALGLILFWPSLFFLDGDGPEAQEYARLKGEYEALEVASIQEKYGYEFAAIALPEKKMSETQDVPL